MCDVTPAGSSSGVPTGRPGPRTTSTRTCRRRARCASFVSRSGWNVSHITASSCVSVIPIDFSASPGCGPCGMPDGCSVTEPISIALPRRELAVDVIDHLLAVQVRVVVRDRDRERVEVELARAERADDEVRALERLVRRRRHVDAPGDRLEVVDRRTSTGRRSRPSPRRRTGGSRGRTSGSRRARAP